MDYPSAALNERAVKFDTEFRRKNRQVSFKPKSVIRNFCEQNVRQQPLLLPKFTLHTLIIAIIMMHFTQNESPIF